MEAVSVDMNEKTGDNYKFNFTVVGSDSTCQVIIFYQPSTDTRELVTETCEIAVIQKAGWGKENIKQDKVALDLLESVYFNTTPISKEQLNLRCAHRMEVVTVDTLERMGDNYK